jgi:hypothetical protein
MFWIVSFIEEHIVAIVGYFITTALRFQGIEAPLDFIIFNVSALKIYCTICEIIYTGKLDACVKPIYNSIYINTQGPFIAAHLHTQQ